ncbi:hypothetical protein ACFE6N_12160 [Pedobacter sp. BG31]|uniref:hypothetical protein n=1 Tax=Pedobacter sp. BG31 TaxID=3349697 RepID=UPI0035F35A6C
MALPFFQLLAQQSDASGSRSTILKSLTWFLALLFILLGAAMTAKADSYITIFIIVLISITSFVFLSAFVYCLFTDKDALRSESYSIKKMQIEKGIIGDSTTGILPETATSIIDVESEEESA